MTIQAITYDFWSTLYRSQTIDYSQRLLRLKERVEQGSGTTFDLEQFKEAVAVARHTWSQTWEAEHRTIGAEEWLGIILAELGISLPPAYRLEVARGMEDSVLTEVPTLEPEAKSLLAELSSQYRLGIISDTGITPGRVLRQILEKDGIIGYFNHLTFSDEIGRSKPHPEAFLTTLHHLETTPKAAVHIGDLLRTDIAGAKGVKMRAVQYIGIGQDEGTDLPASVPDVTPDAVISKHTELRALLAEWGG